ncbi:MAG: DMT family transporter [Myxococcaceae bacterium]
MTTQSQLSPTPAARAKADSVLVFITAFWGWSFVIVKDALLCADPFTFLSLRFLLGALVGTAFAGKRMLDRYSVRSGLKLSLLLCAGYTLQTCGLQYTTPSRSAFITGLCVVLVPFCSFIIFKRAPRVFALAGVALAATGLYLLTLAVEATAATPKHQALGDFLTLLCAIAYAFHITLNERYAPNSKVTTLVATQLWVVSAVTGLLALLFPHHLDPRPSLWIAIAVTGTFGSAGAIVLQTWAQARTTAVRAALIFALEPVFTSVYSQFMGVEHLGRPEVLGGALIISGVLVAELGGPLLERMRERGQSA